MEGTWPPTVAAADVVPRRLMAHSAPCPNPARGAPPPTWSCGAVWQLELEEMERKKAEAEAAKKAAAAEAEARRLFEMEKRAKAIENVKEAGARLSNIAEFKDKERQAAANIQRWMKGAVDRHRVRKAKQAAAAEKAEAKRKRQESRQAALRAREEEAERRRKEKEDEMTEGTEVRLDVTAM